MREFNFEILTEEEYSPYKVASLLKQLGVRTRKGEEIRPQMVYNYVAKGEKSNAAWTIQSTKNSLGKKVVKKDEVVRWVNIFTAAQENVTSTEETV